MISKTHKDTLKSDPQTDLGFLLNPQHPRKQNQKKLHVSVHFFASAKNPGCAVCGATESVEVTDVGRHLSGQGICWEFVGS